MGSVKKLPFKIILTLDVIIIRTLVQKFTLIIIIACCRLFYWATIHSSHMIYTSLCAASKVVSIRGVNFKDSIVDIFPFVSSPWLPESWKFKLFTITLLTLTSVHEQPEQWRQLVSRIHSFACDFSLMMWFKMVFTSTVSHVEIWAGSLYIEYVCFKNNDYLHR